MFNHMPIVNQNNKIVNKLWPDEITNDSIF